MKRPLLFIVVTVLMVFPVTAQSPTSPGVKTLQVTLGAGTNTRITTTDLPCRQLYIQNNAGHNIRVGDANTTSSRGALIAFSATPPGGSLNVGAFPDRGTNASTWYIAGTAADVIDVTCTQ